MLVWSSGLEALQLTEYSSIEHHLGFGWKIGIDSAQDWTRAYKLVHILKGQRYNLVFHGIVFEVSVVAEEFRVPFIGLGREDASRSVVEVGDVCQWIDFLWVEEVLN